MKFGFDLHGVLDASPEMFAAITKALVKDGHEVHIITGSRDSKDLQNHLKNLNITYTHIFSITTYHEDLGTPMTYDEHGNPHMDAYTWDKTKGDYCYREKMALIFDDSPVYDYFFYTPYARFNLRDRKRYGRQE